MNDHDIDLLDIMNWKDVDPFVVVVQRAQKVFQHTQSILLNVNSSDLYAMCLNHICTVRSEIAQTKASTFMYIVECQLRLALIESKKTLIDGSRIGYFNERITRSMFDIMDVTACIQRAKDDYINVGCMSDDLHNMFAFHVCFEQPGGSRITWDEIETFDCLSSQDFSSLHGTFTNINFL